MSGPPPGVSGPSGPPYLPQVWLYGGRPDLLPDVPLCAAYLTAYLAAAVIHKVVFLKNKKKGQKFVMSAMTFGMRVSNPLPPCADVIQASALFA